VVGEDFLFNCAFLGVANTIYISKRKMYYYFKRNSESLTGAYQVNELERRRTMDAAFLKLLKYRQVYDKRKTYYDAQIGAVAYQSVSSVTTKSCSLSELEKCTFIKTIVESEYGQYMEEYEKSDEVHFGNKIILRLLKARKYRLVLCLLNIKCRR
jgi:hypothetical protein